MKKDGSYRDEISDREFGRKRKIKLQVVHDAIKYNRYMLDEFNYKHKLRFAKTDKDEYVCIWDIRLAFDYNMHEAGANNNLEVLMHDKGTLRYFNITEITKRHEEYFKQPSSNFRSVFLPWALGGFQEDTKLKKKPVIKKGLSKKKNQTPHEVFADTVMAMYKTCRRENTHKIKLLMWLEKAYLDLQQALKE